MATMSEPRFDKIIDGVGYIRSFVSEVTPGDVTAWGETVESVNYAGDNRYIVSMTNGYASVYSELSTILTKAD